MKTCAKEVKVLDFLQEPQKTIPPQVKPRTPFYSFLSN